MTVYIFRGDECVDEYNLPTCSFEIMLDYEHWNNFGSWLFSKGYLRAPYRLAFK